MAKSKAKAKNLSPVQKEAIYLKKRMRASRFTGIFACLIALASIGVYYFNVINEWLCIILLAYCIGTIFNSNSFLQNIKVGNPWQRINGICSVVFYALVVALIIYAFVTKNLSLQF